MVLEDIDRGSIGSSADRLIQTVASIAAHGGGGWDKAEEHYQTVLRLGRELVMEAIAIHRSIAMPKAVEMVEALLGESYSPAICIYRYKTAP